MWTNLPYSIDLSLEVARAGLHQSSVCARRPSVCQAAGGSPSFLTDLHRRIREQRQTVAQRSRRVALATTYRNSDLLC
jgi:hypothetical protein